jgi:hypothetical protein
LIDLKLLCHYEGLNLWPIKLLCVNVFILLIEKWHTQLVATNLVLLSQQWRLVVLCHLDCQDLVFTDADQPQLGENITETLLKVKHWRPLVIDEVE